MFNTVAEILELRTADSLRQAFVSYEAELVQLIAPLETMLDKTVHSMDPSLNFTHGAQVAQWRNTIAKHQMFMKALEEHAKSACFLMPKDKGVTDTDREAHRRGLAGPFVAWGMRLEKLIEDIDARVNWCKKLFASEEQGRKSGFKTDF